MALDIYVMPLWRFKAGDFRSAVETATGYRPKIVTADGIEERPASVGWLDRWRAKRQVAALRKAVEAVNQARVRRDDEGGVIYSEQTRGMEGLRAYAMWLDCREEMPEFGLPPEGNYYNHPARQLEVERLSCPHLVKHDCNSGYFLPCEFDRLAKVEPYKVFGHLPATRSVGSSTRLLRELDFVQEHLRVPEDYDPPSEDQLASIKFAYLQLREAAELSCRHGLPIIFWG
jgi:hypothetical protein